VPLSLVSITPAILSRICKCLSLVCFVTTSMAGKSQSFRASCIDAGFTSFPTASYTFSTSVGLNSVTLVTDRVRVMVRVLNACKRRLKTHDLENDGPNDDDDDDDMYILRRYSYRR